MGGSTLTLKRFKVSPLQAGQEVILQRTRACTVDMDIDLTSGIVKLGFVRECWDLQITGPVGVGSAALHNICNLLSGPPCGN